MAKFVVEFSPPEKIKSEPDDVTNSVINYRMVLAPFQKQTQVEFNNIKLKETSVRFLTVVNPLDKPGQFVLPPPSDGVYFDIYKFSLEPNSQCDLSITWKPFKYGNMRKLIKIEQIDSNRKYDFVILGNCNSPQHKEKKNANSTCSKIKNSNLNKRQLNYSQKKVSPKLNKKIKFTACKTEKIPSVKNQTKISEDPISTEKLQFTIRRETYLVGEKENLPIIKNNVLGRDTVLTSPERSVKRPDQRRQDYVFNNHFNLKNLYNSSSSVSGDSLEKSFINTSFNNSQFNELFSELTPLRSTENLICPFSTIKQSNGFDGDLSFDVTDGKLISNSSLFKSEDTLTTTNITDDENTNKSLPTNLYNEIIKTSIDEFKCKSCVHFGSDTINQESFVPSPEIKRSSDFEQTNPNIVNHCTMITLSGAKRPSFSIKNSRNKLKQCRTSAQTTCSKTPKLDKCDQYLKCLTNPEPNHKYAVNPFFKMSEYYEIEWLDRQESDMIRWLNTLLTPTEKLIDEDQSSDLEQASMAWIEASKTCHKNKPMQFATQKDLFVAQIYRQSPQQWSALRKATTNLIMSTNISSVLSKLTISIEKDLITVRDDRQIHLDLSLKKKIIDLLKCYNPLWIRIGLEAIYGQIVHVKLGSSDLDGVGWFVRKNLFNNDFVKQKFTKTSVLQVNLPSYNTAMKKFILRKILMLIYFLDRAKEQQLIRHNPCLFKTDSPYKSSYDLLIGFCADMVIAHGDIIRRLRNIGYNLTHKQTHLDEVNYAIKSLNDLRDGTRITRIVEILFKGNPLSQKLRLPAISKLQKIHNVNLAFTRIFEHISIEGNISTRDIVNGHREKILSLFWQIIYKYLTPRYNNAATKIQKWWRNSNLKLVILKRIRVKQITMRHLATSKIQAHVRGYLTRKQWPHLRTKLIKNREMLHVASTKIKHYLKDKLKLLTEERKRFIILRKTVICIQRKFRNKMVMIKERNKYLKTIQSTVIIQKVFRGIILRKNWPRIKEDLKTENTRRINAINIIKRVLRKNLPLTLDRIKFLKLKQTILYIESQYIAKRAMKLQMEYYTNLKIVTKSVQQKIRGNIAMKKEQKKYLKIKISILCIQKVFRGFMVRKHWPDTRNHLILEKNNRVNSINTVKRAIRRILPKTRDHLNFVKLKYTVLYIQRLYKANRLMKLQLEYYTTLKRTTLFVQRKFRANIFMKRERNNFLKTKESVLLIQKVFRGFMARKCWPDTQNRLMLEKENRICAINIVKRVLRQNLPETRERTNFLKLKSTVIFVQQKWRANSLMKTQREWYITSQYATVFIQRKIRANIVMRTDRQEYLKARYSALLIQKVYQGYVIRKNWSTIKNLLMAEKKKRIIAANIIIRFLHKILPATPDQLYYRKLRHSTVTIQRRFRANISTKIKRNEFQLLKNNTITIQQKFRAQRSMMIERKRYTLLKICTVRLQSVIRGYLIRKQWPQLRTNLQMNRMNLIKCVDVIKVVLRNNLPPTKDRVQFLKLKKSAIVLQQRFQANREARISQNTYTRLKTTTIGFQSAMRGYLFRRNVWPALRIKLLEDRLRLTRYSNILKRFLRRCLPVTNDRASFLKLKIAATVLQNRFRANRSMRKQRYTYTKAKLATILLQSVTRGYLFRQKVWPILRIELTDHRKCLIKSVNTIKRTLKKSLSYSDRQRFLEFRGATVIIQRAFRARCQIQWYQKFRATIVMVQRTFRARRQRSKYIHIRTVTIMLQAYARGFLMRQQWHEMKHSLRAHRHQLIVASDTIKKFLRQCLPITSERSKFLSLKRAAITVQTHYRATVLARLNRIEYLQLRHSVIVLQRCYRARLTTRAIILLQAYIRGYLARRMWSKLKNRLETDRKLAIKALWVKNCAASKIQAAIKGFLARKKLHEIKNQLQTKKQTCAATLIQAYWKGYCVRKKYQCRRETVRMPKNDARTLGRRHDDVLDVLNKQKKHEYSYKELSTVFWNLDICTSLSKELCIKTVEGTIIDCIFHFLLYSNQSQPSMEAREPAIRVLTNLLRYRETSQTIWKRAISADIIKELIKIMKTSCGKFGATTKVYCSIATWIWIALQDPEKKRYIKRIPIAIIDFKFMMDTLNRKYKTHKVDKKLMMLPSTRPTWFIGSKCQKCFESDLYATTQVCKILNIIK